MPDFDELIPELRDWNDGKGIDIDAWICGVGRFDHAVGYGRLFWPEFAIHDDCVMFAGYSVEVDEEWMTHTGGQRGQVEAVMNHHHIVDLFCVGDDSGVSRELVVHLGRLLQDMWACKVKRDFPAREIIVSFNDEHCDDLIDYQITVYHKKHVA